MKLNNIVLWLIAIVITLFSVFYQRLTGPTHPVRGQVSLAGEAIKYRLIRTYETGEDARVVIKEVSPDVTGEIKYKRYKSHDEWTTAPLKREGNELAGYLPMQPAAGKMMYHVTLNKGGQQVLLNEDPAILRYKGAVPAFILVPHILLMFLAMLFSARTGLEALARRPGIRKFTRITFYCLLIGGLILGPIVQKYAFGAFWTGWPFGTDLTDNKTLVLFILWAVAYFKVSRNPQHRLWPIVAAVVMFLIYLIPHSTMGSEIDHTATGSN